VLIEGHEFAVGERRVGVALGNERACTGDGSPWKEEDMDDPELWWKRTACGGGFEGELLRIESTEEGVVIL
jgi:hypothetical protein